MRKFLIGLAWSPVVLIVTMGFWWLVFDGIDRQERIYQECGGRYCAPLEGVK